jgi:parallel beta-helix repeat protein
MAHVLPKLSKKIGLKTGRIEIHGRNTPSAYHRTAESAIISRKKQTRRRCLSVFLLVIIAGPLAANNILIDAFAEERYSYSPAFVAKGSNYYDIRDDPSLHLHKFSLGAWFKTSQWVWEYDHVIIAGKGGFGSESGGKNMNYGLWMTKLEKISAGFENSAGENFFITTNGAYNDGKWHYAIVTYDGSTLALYLDGQRKGRQHISVTPDASGSQPLRIGANSLSSDRHFKGEIDEVKVWDRALSETEIRDYYSTGIHKVDGLIVEMDGISHTMHQASDDTSQPSGKVTINSGAHYAASASIKLGLSCSDADSECSQMKISVDGALDDESFEPFAVSKSVTLPSGDGQKFVKAVFKDSAGNTSPTVEDSIILDTASPKAPTISNPPSGSKLTNMRPTFSGNAEAGATVKLFANGNAVPIAAATAGNTGTWSATPNADLSAGSNSIRATATDKAGNASPLSPAVNLDVVVDDDGGTSSPGISYTFCDSGCNYNNLQTAINAVSSAGGGKVLIKDGTYTLSSTIYLKSGVTIEFSQNAEISTSKSGITLFRGGGISNVKIIGGSITATHTGVKAFSIYNSNQISFYGTKISLVKGDRSTGVYCINCKNVSIENVDFRSASRLVDIKPNEHVADGRSAHIWIKNSKFSEASIEGVKVNYSTDVHIIGNTVTDTDDNGIDIGFNKGTEVRENTILRTGMPNGAAIHTDDADGASIIDNYIDTTGQSGIAVYRASNIKAIGNTIKNTANSGIAITTGEEPSEHILIESNRIISAGTFGIYQSPNQHEVEIAYNTIEDAGEQGIYVVWSNNPTTTVHDNTVT